MLRDGQILAMILFNASPAEWMSAHAAIIAGLEKGTLRPVIGKVLPRNKRLKRMNWQCKLERTAKSFWSQKE